MRIDQAGNVGIGTTSPAGLLHVSSGTSGDALVIIESDTDNDDENDNPQLQFKQDGGNTIAKIGLSGDAGTIFTSSLANAAYFGNDEAASVQLYTNATARLTIESGGDVGIGTTNPGSKLEVNSGGSDSVARFTSTDARARILISDNNDISYFGTYIGTTFLGPDDTPSGNTINVLSNGNVGIGTTSPGTFILIRYRWSQARIDTSLSHRVTNGYISAVTPNMLEDSNQDLAGVTFL